MITGPQLRAVRFSIGWEPKSLAVRAKMPVSVVMRVESSSGEPMVTIVQLNALLEALRSVGASFPPADPKINSGVDRL